MFTAYSQRPSAAVDTVLVPNNHSSMDRPSTNVLWFVYSFKSSLPKQFRMLATSIVALFLTPLLRSSCAEAGAQTEVNDTAAHWLGQRIIMLEGLAAVHIGSISESPRTVVGINLVTPVHRVEGRKLWILSTSGGDSGWVDIGSVRLLTGSLQYFDTLIARDPR